jgi:hypothetical protein
MEPTLHTEVCFPIPSARPFATLQGDNPPILAICRTTRHRSQQIRVDLDDLLDCPTGNVASCCGTRIDGDDDTSLESEGEGGCSVGELDFGGGVGGDRVGVEVEEGGGL